MHGIRWLFGTSDTIGPKMPSKESPTEPAALGFGLEARSSRLIVRCEFSHETKKLVSNDRSLETSWCDRWDLNPYVLPHTPLKRACLPIPALSQNALHMQCMIDYTQTP